MLIIPFSCKSLGKGWKRSKNITEVPWLLSEPILPVMIVWHYLALLLVCLHIMTRSPLLFNTDLLFERCGQTTVTWLLRRGWEERWCMYICISYPFFLHFQCFTIATFVYNLMLIYILKVSYPSVFSSESPPSDKICSQDGVHRWTNLASRNRWVLLGQQPCMYEWLVVMVKWWVCSRHRGASGHASLPLDALTAGT